MAGGATEGQTRLATAEIYSPTTNQWSAAPPMSVARYGATGSLLPNGQVLVAGGFDGSSYLATAELYTPVSGVVPSYRVCELDGNRPAAKSGAVVPIKIEVCSSSGDDLSTPELQVVAVNLDGGAPVSSAGASNPGNMFRFDPSLGQSGGYIFN